MTFKTLVLVVFSFSFQAAAQVHTVDSIQKRIEPYLNLQTRFDGPNCWGSALFSIGVLPTSRFLSKGEFESSLALYCQKLAPNEQPQTGDVGAVRSGSSNSPSEQHAFVFLGQDLVAEKYNPDRTSTLQMRSPKPTFEAYGTLSDSGVCVGGIKRPCVTFVDYFRCSSRASSLGKLPNATEIESFERLLSGLVYEPAKTSRDEWKRYEQADKAYSSLKKSFKASGLTGQEAWHWENALSSYSAQLNYVKNQLYREMFNPNDSRR